MSAVPVAAPEVTWIRVCRVGDIIPDRGVAALVDGQQVAIFVLSDPAGGEPAEVYAVDNRDPYSRANVMARGLVGSAGDRPIVASPLYKHRFDLRDGTCLDGDLPVGTWPARITAGAVEVGVGVPAERG